MTYIGYSFYLRYNTAKKNNRSSDKENSNNKYSNLNISDAEFKDIDNK